MKNDYQHDLVSLYNDIPVADQILSSSEFEALEHANSIYSDKKIGGFEYFNPGHALKGYSEYPDLEGLVKITRKVLRYDA